MEYRVFPATGDRLCVLGFGAMGFAGWFGPVDDRDAVRALHTALDLGVNVVDTARAYGRSEQVLGTALRSWSGARPFVATKVQPIGPKHQFAAPPPVEEVFPKGWVTESCETSLRELGLDQVDLLQLHLYWPTRGHDGFWMEELQGLRQSGKARSVGISIPDHRHDSAISLVQSGLIDSVQVIRLGGGHRDHAVRVRAHQGARADLKLLKRFKAILERLGRRSVERDFDWRGRDRRRDGRSCARQRLPGGADCVRHRPAGGAAGGGR